MQSTAGAMDAIIPTIVGLSGSPGDLEQLRTQLRTLAPMFAAPANQQAVAEALLQLDPSAHSLGVLHLL